MSKLFKTVMADPPWPYSSPAAVVGNGGRGAMGGKVKEMTQTNVLHHYPVMSIDNICALDVEKYVEKDAHLYLWTTNSFMVEAHAVAAAWGFKPKTILTWVKTQQNDPHKPSMKTGYWYRSATEHLLFCVRGKLRLQSDVCRPTAFLVMRDQKHSRKPDFFRELIEEQSPPEYLELFARQQYKSWECWGNEVESTLQLGTP